MKTCTKCLKLLDYTYFHRAKNIPDGYHTRCMVCKNKSGRKHYHKNKESINVEKRKKYCPKVKHGYYLKNKEKIQQRTALYKKNRYHVDLEFKIYELLSAGLRRLLRGKSKNNRALHYLGCTVSEFQEYIESKFQDGMGWENWSQSGWHLDHIIPLSSFNLLDEGEIMVACHYTNFQPLWAKDNFKKGAKLPHELDD